MKKGVDQLMSSLRVNFPFAAVLVGALAVAPPAI